MKKRIPMFLTMIIILLSLAACGNTDTTVPTDAAVESPTQQNEDEAGEDGSANANDDTAAPQALSGAYEIYLTASELLEDAGSIEMIMYTDSLIIIDEMEIDMRMVSHILQIMHSPTEVEMRMQSTASMGGMESASLMYFRDGVMYMQDAMMGNFKVYLPMETILEMANNDLIAFGEDAILRDSITELDDGNLQLFFALDAFAMTDIVDAMMDAMSNIIGEIDDINFALEDIYVYAVVDADNNLVSTDMFMLMTADIDDFFMAMSMEMAMDVLQVGGITIDFPDYLDEFEEF